MKSTRCLCASALLALGIGAGTADEPHPPSTAAVSGAIRETDAFVVIEAEQFLRQSRDDVRRWYRIGAQHSTPSATPDGDPSHAADASGSVYVEVLPDTRRTHADKLKPGENFSPKPGEMAVLDYRVRFDTPGRYYVWVRAYSSGPEDNGLHVGLDGQWPESGQRMQWCEGKKTWRWDSKQRTEQEHCGEPYLIYLDVTEPGVHTISFSMREDGFEFDQWLLTRDRDFERPVTALPVAAAKP